MIRSVLPIPVLDRCAVGSQYYDMPRKVLGALLHDIQRDISAHFHVGDRYRSVRKVAQHFGVSLQTAHRAITQLIKNGMLVAKQKSGLHVISIQPNWKIIPPKIVLLSNNPDPRFNQAVLLGLRDALAVEKIEVKLVLNTQADTTSLRFGEWIGSLKADGVVAMSFRNSALPFYFAQTHGVNLISGIIYDDLPALPAVQHNNTLHAEEAARAFHALGKKRVLCAGYWDPARNRRYDAFVKTYAKLNPRCEVSYAWLAKPDSVAKLHLFFMHFQTDIDAVFSLEYSANYAVAPYFVSHKLTPRNNFLVFNNENQSFQYPGLASVRGVAPSLRDTGTRLGEKLLARLKDGRWPEPLVESIGSGLEK